MSKSLFLSILPRYSNAILDGRKTVELRKQQLKANIGTVIYLYSSGDVKAIEGTAVVAGKTLADVATLWPALGHQSCISQAEYEKYYNNKQVAHAIHIAQPHRFQYPVPLDYLRQRGVLDNPPQTWVYLNDKQVDLIKDYQ